MFSCNKLPTNTGSKPTLQTLQERILSHVKYLGWSFFMKIVNGWNPLTTFAKSSISDIWQGSEFTLLYICSALRNLVPFVQFKKREKHPRRSVNFNKVAGLYKWYQIAQRTTYALFMKIWFNNTVNRPKLCGNCAFPQNFHTRKWGETTIFFTV